MILLRMLILYTQKSKYNKMTDIIDQFIIESHNLQYVDKHKYEPLKNFNIDKYIIIIHKKIENKIKYYGKILQKKGMLNYM